jgi:tetratricopeptide (TPR) repeat protein
LNIAFVYSAQGLHQKSLFHSFKTLEFLSNSEEHEGIASAYHNLGIEYQYMKQNARAVLAFKKGFRISKKFLGDSHELTRVLRACYFESQKATTILTTKSYNFSQSDHQEITHIINELEKYPLKSLTPVPNNTKKKKISLVPLKTACLIKSIQCGNLRNLNKTQHKFLSKSPVLKRKSNSIHNNGRSLDTVQDLIPIPSKSKIVISGRHYFTIENKGNSEFSDVIGRRKTREVRSVNKSKQIIRSVVKIQKIWRMMREKLRFLKMKKSAVKIQAVFRGYRDRKFCRFLIKS